MPYVREPATPVEAVVEVRTAPPVEVPAEVDRRKGMGLKHLIPILALLGAGLAGKDPRRG